VDIHPFSAMEKYHFDKRELNVQFRGFDLSQLTPPDHSMMDQETKEDLDRLGSKLWTRLSCG
jgi:hypothetical protein